MHAIRSDPADLEAWCLLVIDLRRQCNQMFLMDGGAGNDAINERLAYAQSLIDHIYAKVGDGSSERRNNKRLERWCRLMLADLFWMQSLIISGEEKDKLMSAIGLLDGLIGELLQSPTANCHSSNSTLYLALCGLGRCLGGLGEFDKASAAYQQALQFDHPLLAIIEQAVLLEQQRELLAESQQFISSHLQVLSDSQGSLIARLWQLLQTLRCRDGESLPMTAAELLNESLKIDSGSPLCRYLQAIYLLKIGQPAAKAIKILHSAADSDDDGTQLAIKQLLQRLQTAQ
jgi:tetratricopeptide (TPR) repeat protein